MLLRLGDRQDAFIHLRGMRLRWLPKGRYAVAVIRNWRITFAWDDGDAVQVDFEDYHGK